MPPALTVGADRHRRQGHGVHGAAVDLHPQIAEQDVADEFLAVEGHERQGGATVLVQPDDKLGFVVAVEDGAVERHHRSGVGRGLIADRDQSPILRIAINRRSACPHRPR